MIKKNTHNLFISFEGIDGSGKSTLARSLYEKLIQSGLSVWLTAEPTSDRFGKLVHDWILFSEEPLSPEEQILLFTADRWRHSRIIQSFLDKNFIVISDRYIDSTFAYQGYNADACLLIHHLNKLLFHHVMPNITFLLDIDPEISLPRIQRKKDQFEAIHFLQEVRKRYKNIASENPERVIILDSKQPPEIVEKIMWEGLLQRGLSIL